MIYDSGNILLRLSSDIDKYILEIEEATRGGLRKIKSDNGEENRGIKNLLIGYMSLLELKGTLKTITSIESLSLKAKKRRVEELINYHLIVNKKKENRHLVNQMIEEKLLPEKKI